ncbi:MAG: YeeE/YedE thiosulfate transporter family protein [Cyclobacteriaceae bacterium]
MNSIIDFISQPWPWYVAGPIISLVMFSLLFFGNKFGISSNLRTVCSILGAGKSCEYFDFDWRAQKWNLVFALGMLLGGAISAFFLSSEESVQLSSATIESLKGLGISQPGKEMVPEELFGWDSLFTLKGIIMLVLGGFLVGFGTRYGGGCTSGHAISGLSDLQLPSLIAVIGFFIGGLFVTWLVLPYLITL